MEGPNSCYPGPGDPALVSASLRTTELSPALLSSSSHSEKSQNHGIKCSGLEGTLRSVWFHPPAMLPPISWFIPGPVGLWVPAQCYATIQGPKPCSSVPQWPIQTSMKWLNVANPLNELRRKETMQGRCCGDSPAVAPMPSLKVGGK